jgi:hypothetical protein
MKSYDLYISRQGRWLLDSSYSDRNDAIGQARRMEDSGACDGVRVVEEALDEGRNSTTERTIHWSSNFLTNPQEALDVRRDRRLEAAAYRERIDQRVRQRIVARYQEEREAIRRRATPVRMIAMGAGLFALWIVGALALRYLFDLA